MNNRRVKRALDGTITRYVEGKQVPSERFWEETVPPATPGEYLQGTFQAREAKKGDRAWDRAIRLLKERA